MTSGSADSRGIHGISTGAQGDLRRVQRLLRLRALFLLPLARKPLVLSLILLCGAERQGCVRPLAVSAELVPWRCAGARTKLVPSAAAPRMPQSFSPISTELTTSTVRRAIFHSTTARI